MVSGYYICITINGMELVSHILSSDTEHKLSLISSAKNSDIISAGTYVQQKAVTMVMPEEDRKKQSLSPTKLQTTATQILMDLTSF